jgi:hypothetical protein
MAHVRPVVLAVRQHLDRPSPLPGQHLKLTAPDLDRLSPLPGEHLQLTAPDPGRPMIRHPGSPSRLAIPARPPGTPRAG